LPKPTSIWATILVAATVEGAALTAGAATGFGAGVANFAGAFLAGFSDTFFAGTGAGAAGVVVVVFVTFFIGDVPPQTISLYWNRLFYFQNKVRIKQ
jgi:hypothetical protein